MSWYRAQELVHLYQNMSNGLNDRQLGGVLALGAIPPTFAGLLPEALLLLRQSHPGIVVHVSTGVSSELLSKVEHGELDAAIVSQPPFKLPHNMSWKTVASTSHWCYWHRRPQKSEVWHLCWLPIRSLASADHHGQGN